MFPFPIMIPIVIPRAHDAWDLAAIIANVIIALAAICGPFVAYWFGRKIAIETEATRVANARKETALDRDRRIRDIKKSLYRDIASLDYWAQLVISKHPAADRAWGRIKSIRRWTAFEYFEGHEFPELASMKEYEPCKEMAEWRASLEGKVNEVEPVADAIGGWVHNLRATERVDLELFDKIYENYIAEVQESTAKIIMNPRPQTETLFGKTETGDVKDGGVVPHV